VDITMLAALVAVTVAAFWRVEPAAAWLFAPYLAWIVYAASLNAWIVLRN
jgi:translocator protein